MEDQLAQAALDYHRFPTPGKMAVVPTKPLTNQRDLSLAYSPGVAEPCLDDRRATRTLAYEYTARGNLVARRHQRHRRARPRQHRPAGRQAGDGGQGRACSRSSPTSTSSTSSSTRRDPDKLVDIVAALEPTFGGINLEDIKAPECFYIEETLRERMKIPVFHDDQHGTAIISGAALLNALELVGKQIERGQGRRARAPAPRPSPASTSASASACSARTSSSSTARA